MNPLCGEYFTIVARIRTSAAPNFVSPLIVAKPPSRHSLEMSGGVYHPTPAEVPGLLIHSITHGTTCYGRA